MKTEMTFRIGNDLQEALTNFQSENECSQGTAIALILRQYFLSEGYLPVVNDEQDIE